MLQRVQRVEEEPAPGLLRRHKGPDRRPPVRAGQEQGDEVQGLLLHAAVRDRAEGARRPAPLHLRNRHDQHGREQEGASGDGRGREQAPREPHLLLAEQSEQLPQDDEDGPVRQRAEVHERLPGDVPHGVVVHGVRRARVRRHEPPREGHQQHDADCFLLDRSHEGVRLPAGVRVREGGDQPDGQDDDTEVRLYLRPAGK